MRTDELVSPRDAHQMQLGIDPVGDVGFHLGLEPGGSPGFVPGILPGGKPLATRN